MDSFSLLVLLRVLVITTAPLVVEISRIIHVNLSPMLHLANVGEYIITILAKTVYLIKEVCQVRIIGVH